MHSLPEHNIIRLCLEKPELYKRYNSSVDLNYVKDVYPDLYKVFLLLNTFRLKYPEASSYDDFHSFVLENTRAVGKEREKLEAVLAPIQHSSASVDTVDALLRGMARQTLLQKMAIASYEAIEVPEREAALRLLWESFNKESSDVPLGEEIEFVTDDLEELYHVQLQKPGLRWRLQSLNEALGSIRQGDMGFIFARPETGKTTFLASEVSFMAQQTVSPVLWFNNEEQGGKVKIRIYQGCLGVPLEVLFTDRKKAQARYLKETKGTIRLIDEALISRRFVEKACERYKPSLILFDQIDKITGFDNDREDLRLGAIYQWARELAKTYAPVIGVCQADGSGEGAKWLTMSNVANAKTAKQAEADWILGIGRTNEIGMEQVRHFHLSKNKLIGDPDTRPDRRHDRWDVLILPEIARYQDILYNR